MWCFSSGGATRLETFKVKAPDESDGVARGTLNVAGLTAQTSKIRSRIIWAGEVRVVRKTSPDGIACCEDPNPTPAQVEVALERARQPGFVLLPKRWVRTGPEGEQAR